MGVALPAPLHMLPHLPPHPWMRVVLGDSGDAAGVRLVAPGNHSSDKVAESGGVTGLACMVGTIGLVMAGMPHSTRLESLDSWPKLEQTSTSLDHPVARMLDKLD